jgi:hypothetical protein
MPSSENIKLRGLEIAADFFANWGRACLEREFPELSARVAAGRILGSDVLGADDDLSRDHNWGPQFTLFLSEEDFCRFAEPLSQRMNAAAPSAWHGHRVAGAGDKSVLVESIPRWMARHLGFRTKPEQDADWGVVVRDRRVGGAIEARESSLYFLRHGAIWMDGSGELSQWRRHLGAYPDQVWLGRLAEECFRLWQYGEYNFVHRVAKRGDGLTGPLCLNRFAEGVMRLTLLLNRDFTPYWKCLAHEFRKQQDAGICAQRLETLLRSGDPAEQARLIAEICRHAHERLVTAGAIHGRDANIYVSPLFNAYNELTARATWLAGTL